MAKIEDDTPSFENLNLSGEEAFEEEVVADEPLVEEEVVAIDADQLAELPPIEEMPTAEPLAAEPEPREEPVQKAPLEKEDNTLSRFLPVAAAVGLPVIVLGLVMLQFVLLSTAIYVIAMGYIPLSLWMSRKTNTVYIVFLGCTLVFVLTAIYCLWIEMGRHNFDVKAQEAKQRVSATWPGHNPSDRINDRLIA